jgi:hypothetical protein
MEPAVPYHVHNILAYEYIPHPQTLFLTIHFNIILPSTPVFRLDFFRYNLRPEVCAHLHLTDAACVLRPFIIFDLIIPV